jgi:pimeloyl-ACP methyl ester carboxylesterase
MKRIIFVALAAGALLALAALVAADVAPVPGAFPADVKLTTADGVKLVGSYYAPARADAKGLILLHMLNRDRSDWRHFARKAAEKNIACLAIDMRGHGQSLYGPDNKKLVWKNFKDPQFQGMQMDVAAAYDYLIAQKQVNPRHIGILGASIGANVAAIYAGDHAQQINAIALLSPGVDYHGVKPEAAVKKFPGRMLFFAAPDDEYAYRSVEQMVASAPDRAEFRKMTGGGHGTDLFEQFPEMADQIIAWFGQNL